jgi:hypothetical protein
MGHTRIEQVRVYFFYSIRLFDTITNIVFHLPGNDFALILKY